jgi:hypothetical protein
MLAAFTVVVTLAVGYAFSLQGVLTSFAMLVNVFLAGLVAFNFWEPLAAELPVQDTFADGYQDWICLIGLFVITLIVLRVVTNAIAINEPEVLPIASQIGSVVCGLLTGYLVSGFIICAMQTLPIQEDFLGFSSKVEHMGGMRRFLPSDRVWLAMMQRASVGPLAADGDGFDPRGYFELGFQRHRRHGSRGETIRYHGDDLPIFRGESP